MTESHLPLAARLRLIALYRRRVRHYVREGHRRPLAQAFASFDVYGGDTETIDADGIARPDSGLCPEAEKIRAAYERRR